LVELIGFGKKPRGVFEFFLRTTTNKAWPVAEAFVVIKFRAKEAAVFDIGFLTFNKRKGLQGKYK
jgi:hypothetical protein